jgi:hypothetical protein
VVSVKLWKAPGDGSCFYHCVTHFTGISVKELRNIVSNAVVSRASEDFNGMSLQEWVQNETGMSIQKYAHAVLRGHWGGLVDMQILSDALRRPFVVYVYDRRQMSEATKIMEVHPKSAPGFSCAPNGPILLLYQGRVHYDALDYVRTVQNV